MWWHVNNVCHPCSQMWRMWWVMIIHITWQNMWSHVRKFVAFVKRNSWYSNKQWICEAHGFSRRSLLTFPFPFVSPPTLFLFPSPTLFPFPFSFLFPFPSLFIFPLFLHFICLCLNYTYLCNLPFPFFFSTSFSSSLFSYPVLPIIHFVNYLSFDFVMFPSILFFPSLLPLNSLCFLFYFHFHFSFPSIYRSFCCIEDANAPRFLRTSILLKNFI